MTRAPSNLVRRLRDFTLPACLAGLMLAGCSDPSDHVPKTAGSEPVQTPSTPSARGKEYVIRAGSTIGFTGSKVTGSHSGGFKRFAGKFNAEGGRIVGVPEIRIAMDSVWSDNDRLTGHLKSPDFFDVATHPVTTFSVTSIEEAGVQHRVTGNLNLHGVTRSITFPASILVADDAISVKSEFAINRKDFNINYPGRPDDLIRDNVVLKLDIKATPGPANPEDQIGI